MADVDPRNPNPHNKDVQPYDEYGRPYVWYRGDNTPGMLYSPGGIGKVKEYADRDWLANFIKLHPGFWIPELGHIFSGGDYWKKPDPITNDELKTFEQRKAESLRDIARAKARNSMIAPPPVSVPKPVITPPPLTKGGFVPTPKVTPKPTPTDGNAGMPIKRSKPKTSYGGA